MLALLARKPVVVGHHGYQASCPNGLLFYQPAKAACPAHYMQGEYSVCLRCNSAELGWLGSAKLLILTSFRRSLCRRASVNLCVTNHVAVRIDLPHSQIVYHGIPDSSVPADRISIKETSTRSHLSLGYLGRLVEEKGVPTLIEAMHTLREEKDRVGLTIIGDGPQLKQLEAMAGERTGFRPAITFLGSLKEEKLTAALSGIDVLVMPSLNEEPAGLVVMEQMMRGCGVIVSDHGGGPELAGDSGLKFPAGDAQALAECIRRLLREPGLVGLLGRRARERALKMFTLDRMINQHYQIFQKLCTGDAR
jgi:glycosyltransferase involved in cell wall biosynthesis